MNDWMNMFYRWNDTDITKFMDLEKNFYQCHSVRTNPKRTGLGSKEDLHIDWQVTAWAMGMALSAVIYKLRMPMNKKETKGPVNFTQL
jgi:hypothetical protein